MPVVNSCAKPRFKTTEPHDNTHNVPICSGDIYYYLTLNSRPYLIIVCQCFAPHRDRYPSSIADQHVMCISVDNFGNALTIFISFPRLMYELKHHAAC